MNINLSAKVRGIYDIQIIRKSGIVENYNNNENLITNNFINSFMLNRLSSFSAPRIAVGNDQELIPEYEIDSVPSTYTTKSGTVHRQGKYVTDKLAEVVFKYDFGLDGFIGSLGNLGLYVTESPSRNRFITFDNVINYQGEPAALGILQGDTLIIYYKIQIALPEDTQYTAIGKSKLPSEVLYTMEYKFPTKDDIELLKPPRAVFSNLVGTSTDTNKYSLTTGQYAIDSFVNNGRGYFGANHGEGMFSSISFDMCSAKRYTTGDYITQAAADYAAIKMVLDTPVEKTWKDKFEISFTYTLGRN